MISPSSIDRDAFVARLVAWFARAQRDLAWRHPENARDPYRVLVSEVMLQQTTVAAVIPFYHRFLQRFPTLQALAGAPLEDVLAAWAGLGYYSRARNLHACAQSVAERHGGEFPRDLHELLALPGIGRYTAGAVRSIAFDEPASIVDANVSRVFARVFGIEGDIKSGPNQRRCWSEAESMMSVCEAAKECRPSQLNPALMELGALVCTPAAPRCESCPVREWCVAYRDERQHQLPQFAPKRAKVQLHDVCAFALRDENGAPELLLRRRPHDAPIWWRGLWELPRATIGPDESPADAARRALRETSGLDATPRELLTSLTHGVTHHNITLDCWTMQLDHDAIEGDIDARWATFDAAAELAMPSVMRRLLRWLQRHRVEERQLRLL